MARFGTEWSVDLDRSGQEGYVGTGRWGQAGAGTIRRRGGDRPEQVCIVSRTGQGRLGAIRSVGTERAGRGWLEQSDWTGARWPDVGGTVVVDGSGQAWLVGVARYGLGRQVGAGWSERVGPGQASRAVAGRPGVARWGMAGRADQGGDGLTSRRGPDWHGLGRQVGVGRLGGAWRGESARTGLARLGMASRTGTGRNGMAGRHGIGLASDGVRSRPREGLPSRHVQASDPIIPLNRCFAAGRSSAACGRAPSAPA